MHNLVVTIGRRIEQIKFASLGKDGMHLSEIWLCSPQIDGSFVEGEVWCIGHIQMGESVFLREEVRPALWTIRPFCLILFPNRGQLLIDTTTAESRLIVEEFQHGLYLLASRETLLKHLEHNLAYNRIRFNLAHTVKLAQLFHDFSLVFSIDLDVSQNEFNFISSYQSRLLSSKYAI